MSDKDAMVKFGSEKTMELIMHATEGDGERCADVLQQVGEAYGDRGVFGVCCALAEAIALLSDMKTKTTDDFYGFVVEDLRTGKNLNPDTVDDDAKDVITAMRFVVAHVNGDGDRNAEDFFHGDMQAAIRLPIGLIKLVGAHGRAKIEERRAAGEIE